MVPLMCTYPPKLDKCAPPTRPDMERGHTINFINPSLKLPKKSMDRDYPIHFRLCPYFG